MWDFLKGFGQGFHLFGKMVSFTINLVLLSVVYFIGVGLTSIICKVGKKTFLELEIDKTKKSYWEKREEVKKENCNRMF